MSQEQSNNANTTMLMPSKPTITIIGAGISGLTLGRTLLQKHGIKPTILEKARKSTNRNNYGITLYASAYKPLLKILNGIEEDEFKKRVAVDAGIGGTGKLIRSSDGGFRVNRRRLEEMIGEGLDVKWESEVEDVKSGSVTVKDGEKYESEIVVGADGPHSKVRQTFAPEVEFEILPFAVYNGRRTVKHDEWEAKRINALLEGKVLEQRVGDAIFQVSLNDCTKEELNVSYTYSRPARTKGEDDLFRPERPKNAAREMPEALFTEVGGLREQLEEPFKTVFDPDVMRKDRLLNWLMRTARVEWEKLNEAADQGVVLLGDSVHPEPILGGMGANEAIEDAIQLAGALEKGSRDSIKQFVDERYGVWEEGLAASEVNIEDMHSKQRASL